MSKASPHFKKLQAELIFKIVEEKIEKLKAKDLGNKPLLNFGIGDVAFPIKPSIIKALHEAVDEIGTHVKGYGPSTGYNFLKNTIVDVEYGRYGIKSSEIFISDGIMSDISGLLSLFHKKTKIGVPDPTYPVYLNACVLDGRTSFSKKNFFPEIVYLPCTEATHFVPLPPKKKCDLIFLCSPNNPTGCSLTKAQLKLWIDYAKKYNAVIILDAAYEAFIHTQDTPKSIYEIPEAKDVAIELRSFSKTAGFSGLRLSYAVIPDKVKAYIDKEKISLNQYWSIKQSSTFNGPSYIIQKAGAASLSSQGIKETQDDIKLYTRLRELLKKTITTKGFTCFGGQNSPYLWWKCPNGLSSWEFFDNLLYDHHIITVPGIGFGPRGEGFVRFSTFTTEKDAYEAVERIKTYPL